MILLSLIACVAAIASVNNNVRASAASTSRHGVQANGWGPAKVKQYSGLLTIDGTYKNGSHMFYWLFESQSNPSTDPLVIWLTGGPGCSGELALFYENGPYMLNNVTNKVEMNPWSWNTKANLLYVDNPVGTGFSVADYTQDYVTDETAVASQMLTFVTEFLTMYPQYANLNVSIFCESYGGHYCPAVANAIVKSNAAGTTSIKLTSVGIGNGWTDPKNQYRGYLEFGQANGFINAVEAAPLALLSDACVGLIAAGLDTAALVECNLYMSGVMSAISADVGYEINPYDVRIPCQVPGLCYDFSGITALMNQPAVQKALGVQPTQWEVCDDTVHSLLMGDWMTNLAVDLPAILAANVRVLVYEGTEDFICNYKGAEDWSKLLVWPGQSAYNSAVEKPWHVGGQVAGTSKTAAVQGGLTFLKVFGAGHMVPHDQPQAALRLLETMLQNKPF